MNKNKVYLIHASEDKERFVLNFATKLRDKGIDVWLDKWEMLPGDSLIDKMFEEGIKNAKAFIIVLSNYSINKIWVKEELNASIIKKINEGSKIIPVIIEECEIPEVLKSTLWVKINDFSSYNNEIDNIVSSISGVYEKPPLGNQPEYTKTILDNLPGLTKIDSIVFHFVCENALKLNDFFMQPDDILDDLTKLGINKEQYYECLDILDREYFIKTQRAIDNDIYSIEITTFGFDNFIRIKDHNYNKTVENVVSLIVNKNLENNEAIKNELNENSLIIDHILNVLENNGYIKQSKDLGGFSYIYDVSPQLKRLLIN